jgi:endonuclease G
MSVIDTTSPPAYSSPFDREQHHQQKLFGARITARYSKRAANEKALDGPGGLMKVNEPDRIAKRMDRVAAYRKNRTPSPTPSSAAMEMLAAPTDTMQVQLEKTVGTPDFLGVRYLDEGVAAARSIGRINIVNPDGTRGFGTGFMVSPRLLLTNHHVLLDADTAALSFVEFNYQDGLGGAPLTRLRLGFAPQRFFHNDRDLDFALVAVDDPAGALAGGYNRLTGAQGTVLVGEPVTIVQHPLGQKKQIVLRNNTIVDIPEISLHYTADTEPGSSGSPVFNDQWEVVALHHSSMAIPGDPKYPVLNEGIRISRILGFLRAAQMPAAFRAVVDEDLPDSAAAGPVAGIDEAVAEPPAAPEPDAAQDGGAQPTVPEPVLITVRFNGSVVHAVGTVEPADSTDHAAAEDTGFDYRSRIGYDPDFLGVPLPLPESTVGETLSPELKYHHFSIRMDLARRLAKFTAVNIRGPIDRIPRGRDRWIFDPRLPADQQTGEAVYRDNPLDRGHLVRRLDPAWGPQADAAVEDTFHFTNCTPQHHDFNAGGELWLGLEDYILDHTDNERLQVSVLTGPVLADDDPAYRGVELPRQYWKVVAMVTADGALSATAYLLSQTALLADVATTEAFSFGAYRTFQVPVQRVADLTGLDLSRFADGDPLQRLEATPLPRELLRLQDIVL